LNNYWLDDWFTTLQKNIHDNMNHVSFVNNFSIETRLVVVALIACMKSFTRVPSSIFMEWNLFVRYNVWVALWLSNKFFNIRHIFVSSRRSSAIGIRLSLIIMIKIIRTLSFLDCSKVASFVCYTLAVIVCCVVASSYTPTTSSTTPSFQPMACAWTMGCIGTIVTTTGSIRQTNSHSPCHNSWQTLTFQML